MKLKTTPGVSTIPRLVFDPSHARCLIHPTPRILSIPSLVYHPSDPWCFIYPTPGVSSIPPLVFHPSHLWCFIYPTPGVSFLNILTWLLFRNLFQTLSLQVLAFITKVTFFWKNSDGGFFSYVAHRKGLETSKLDVKLTLCNMIK